MTNSRKYLEIVAHYESCLDRNGDCHLGVDWPNASEAARRYEVMLGLIRPPVSEKRVTLLDFGCGAAHLYEHIRKGALDHSISYSGLDLSEKFVALCRAKFPLIPFHHLDILADASRLSDYDYIVMNGVFTEKRTLSQDEMQTYFQEVVSAVFTKARIGLAFNVMSKQVDWERPDLFHLSFDALACFLTRKVSRNFVFRHDYRLYEYTAYVYR